MNEWNCLCSEITCKVDEINDKLVSKETETVSNATQKEVQAADARYNNNQPPTHIPYWRALRIVAEAESMAEGVGRSSYTATG